MAKIKLEHDWEKLTDQVGGLIGNALPGWSLDRLEYGGRGSGYWAYVDPPHADLGRRYASRDEGAIILFPTRADMAEALISPVILRERIRESRVIRAREEHDWRYYVNCWQGALDALAAAHRALEQALILPHGHYERKVGHLYLAIEAAREQAREAYRELAECNAEIEAEVGPVPGGATGTGAVEAEIGPEPTA